MSGPWEKYQKKPWEQFAKEEAPADDGEFSVGEMVSNIPGSAAGVAESLVTPILHPVETAKTIGKVAGGAVQKAAKAADIGWLSDLVGEDLTPYADAVVDAVVERYGSLDKAKNTLEKDPVGVAVDLASLISGAGALTRSSTVAKAGAAVNPINATVNAAKVVVGKAVPDSIPANMYEGVAKFSTTIPKDKRAALVDTALNRGLAPTSAGVDKLTGLIDGLNTKIDGLIQTAQASGGTIPKQAIYKHLSELRASKGGVKLGAPKDLATINKVVREFDVYLKQLGKKDLTPEELQTLKVDAYKKINWDAKRGKGSQAKEDTYKAVAKGAKEGLEQLAPDVKATNKELGELLELQPSLQRSANRIENRNLISIDTPLQIGAGAGAGGGVGAAIGVVSSVLGIPKIKAANAIWLRKAANTKVLQAFMDNNSNISNAELIAILAGEATKNNQQPSSQE